MAILKCKNRGYTICHKKIPKTHSIVQKSIEVRPQLDVGNVHLRLGIRVF